MAHVVETAAQLEPMLLAARAIVLVSVAWSPWHKESRKVLADLEATWQVWSPSSSVEFYDLWPERDAALNAWYDDLCEDSFPTFELHGRRQLFGTRRRHVTEKDRGASIVFGQRLAPHCSGANTPPWPGRPG
jgi:hypothetical protein